MVLRKYRYLAIEIMSNDDDQNTVCDKIRKIAGEKKGERLLYKLVNMTLIDFLKETRIFVIRVDRPASRELVESLSNGYFKILYVSGIYKKLLKKLEKHLKGEFQI